MWQDVMIFPANEGKPYQKSLKYCQPLCVCVRACVVIIFGFFFQYFTSLISLQYAFRLKYVKLCNNNN